MTEQGEFRERGSSVRLKCTPTYRAWQLQMTLMKHVVKHVVPLRNLALGLAL